MNESREQNRYTIGQAADLLGCATSTIRYYDKMGLLPFMEKNEGGRRYFTDFDISWLKMIELFKLSGLRLDEIEQMQKLGLSQDETIGERLDIYNRVRERVQNEIAQLQTVQAILDFNISYYEKALAAGSLKAVRKTPLGDYPEPTQQLIQQYGLILDPSPFEEALEKAGPDPAASESPKSSFLKN